jgi:hypothetical protein
MGEARNGATDMIDKIARLPGLQKTCVRTNAMLSSRVMESASWMLRLRDPGGMVHEIRFDKVSAIKEDYVTTARRELHELAHSHGPTDGKLHSGDRGEEMWCSRMMSLEQENVPAMATVTGTTTVMVAARKGTIRCDQGMLQRERFMW